MPWTVRNTTPRRPVFWLALVLAHGLIALLASSAQAEPQDPLCAGEGTSVSILSPTPGTALAMELHGMGEVAVHLKVLICNFDSRAGIRRPLSTQEPSATTGGCAPRQETAQRGSQHRMSSWLCALCLESCQEPALRLTCIMCPKKFGLLLGARPQRSSSPDDRSSGRDPASLEMAGKQCSLGVFTIDAETLPDWKWPFFHAR